MFDGVGVGAMLRPELHPYLYHVPLQNTNIWHLAWAHLAVLTVFWPFGPFFGHIQKILLIL